MPLEPFAFQQEGWLVGLRQFSPDAADDQADLLEAINRYTLRPLTLDEIAVFTLDLCHNQIDRHHSRFPDEELERINALVPGRPLMERHDLRGSLPRGTFFRSTLHRDADRLSVRPEVYVLRTPENAGFIANIEGGVYRETSIGFSFRTPECSVCGKDLRTCEHIPGRSYDDHTCHFIMHDVLEVIEGSVVASGSQGTRFVPHTREFDPPLPQEPAAAPWPEACLRTLEILAETPERATQLLRDGQTARHRAIARFCGLGRELDGPAFDETLWRKCLDTLALDEIHQHLRAYEQRFDLKYPPHPITQPEPLDSTEHTSREATALSILHL